MEKKIIRREVRAAIRALTDEQSKIESCRIVERLVGLITERRPRTVALFAPLPDEANILPLLSRLDCRIVLPRVEAQPGDDTPRMEFYDYSPETMAEGAYGIAEPQGTTPCEASQIDLMVIPGIAFTPAGDRLGRGKGFYDCYLSREGFRALRVGVCYGCQLREKLPTDPHDRQVDVVITGAL